MELMKGAKREAMMAYLTATATADSEGDVDSLLKLFNPVESREDMGEIFEDTLGYNPITHYDIKDVIKVVDDAIDHVSSAGVKTIVANKTKIVDKAMEIYEARRMEHIQEAVATAMVDFLNSDDSAAASFYLTGRIITLDPLADADDEDDEESVSDGLLEDDDDLDDDLGSIKGLGDDDEDFGFDEDDEED